MGGQETTDKPHAGFWQTLDYSVWERPKDGASPQLVPVTAIQPKAVTINPKPGAILELNKPRLIDGWAWAGANGVAKVELSIDDGKTWVPSNKPAKGGEYRTVHWVVEITPKQKGPMKILARCTDDKGNTQSEKRDADRRSYMINHLVPVEVTVK